jgi:sigma-B regulation protein RsbU (phosphoserine phosphatase)
LSPDDNSVLRTLPGRLFLLASLLSLALLSIRQFLPLPAGVDLFRKVTAFAWVVSAIWLAIQLFGRSRRRLLWRVRQKLILSYVFLGFVPVLLIGALTLVAALVLYLNISSYIFSEAFSDISREVSQTAETAAVELGRTPATAEATLARKYANMSARYPGLSLALVALDPATAIDETKLTGPLPPPPAPLAVAGAWRHMESRIHTPSWLLGRPSFEGLVAVAGIDDAPAVLVMRSFKATPDGQRGVIVDLPVDADVAAEVERRSDVRMGPHYVPSGCVGAARAAAPAQIGGPVAGGFFRQTVAFLPCTGWLTAGTAQATVSLEAPVRRLYARVTRLQVGGAAGGYDFFLTVLIVLAVLFLIIQGSALLMGALLARSITYAVHELFVGTERVRHGDFTHRIQIDSGDQLGELATSFNVMSSSVEHLLHVQREKQRLDDELRIAREIQKSLLPAAPPIVAGMSIADLCEPAREVGGDYYDFFDLGHRRIGVMIADVSGKGTSAALYMAEVKGLMLALSRREHSPRRLLIEANRLLSAHLDNRSFITMTYAVLDLDARSIVCARAGHTPLIVVSNGSSEVLIPSGMVLGLRLPGAAERFEEILEEHTRPLRDGDVVVLYTDGITEAMDTDGELFSDASLAGVIVAQQHLDAAGIRERVIREVRAFVGEAEPHDDMTMIVMKMGA